MMLKCSWLFFTIFVFGSAIYGKEVSITTSTDDKRHEFNVGNQYFVCKIIVENEILKSEKLVADRDWLAKYGSDLSEIENDAGFELDVMWTGWRAPDKIHNADNPVLFSNKNFKYTGYETKEFNNGGKELHLFFEGKNNSFKINISYQLDENSFFIRKKLSVRDPENRNHFLRWIWPYKSLIKGELQIIKSGGFGNPLVIRKNDGGAFFGLEYPASTNKLTVQNKQSTQMFCGQEMGVRLDSTWTNSEWAVTGMVPDYRLKFWFKKYLDTIRVAKLKPYLLYNTWYDVRSPEYTERSEDVMNEKNLLRIIADFKREMIEKRGLKLDAFVLDDAWDVYKSDWTLRSKEFPNGLKPIVKELNQMDTDLGIWFGPIGGYSYRKWRVNWMREHGYEAEDDQLCIAGKNYHKLFEKRVVDFVKNDGVAYYKWDGIQFSCSEPDHGHPVGIYSRRAVMEAVKDLTEKVRKENPEIFLNITSGTWLSPWWLKYANMIWMQGYDYGYANVPSISKRDAAITYRDVVLYENYGDHDFWFPISNLMTHGIIKGHLQKLGGETEPLDKFTDNAILYFARGVTMWELYISPNLLTDEEWNAIAKSIRWAKDRFDILKQTEMIGCNPELGKPYGYIHFSGEKGIIALRNPVMEPQIIKIKLDPNAGLDGNATHLVLEKNYPYRWISPDLYSAEDEIEISLDGYETAIYEIFPVKDSEKPLLAGAVFEESKTINNSYVLNLYKKKDELKILNPDLVRSIQYNKKSLSKTDLSNIQFYDSKDKIECSIEFNSKKNLITANTSLEIPQLMDNIKFAVLIKPDKEFNSKELPVVDLFLGDEKIKTNSQSEKSAWIWHTAEIPSGKHQIKINILPSQIKEKWQGNCFFWLIYHQKQQGVEVTLNYEKIITAKPLPPLPWPADQKKTNLKIAEQEIIFQVN